MSLTAYATNHPPIEVPIATKLVRQAERLAQKRCEYWNSRRVETLKRSDRRGDAEIHALGFIAEGAVAAYFGVPWNRSWARGGDGNRGDVQIGELAVQVKATEHPTGRLIVPFPDKLDCDALLLVHVDRDRNTAAILGGLSMRRFRRVARYAAELPTPAYVVEQAELSDARLLLRAIRDRLPKEDRP